MPFHGATAQIGTQQGVDLNDNPVSVNSKRTQAHGLGAVPNMLVAHLQCVTAQYGYVSGDQIYLFTKSNPGGGMGGTDDGCVIGADATNVWYFMDSNRIYVNRLDTGAIALLTGANWQIFIHSYL